MPEKRIRELMLDLDALERISPDTLLAVAIPRLGEKLRHMFPPFLVVVDETNEEAKILGMLSVDDILARMEPSAVSMEELPIFWQGQFHEECGTILERPAGDIMSPVTHVVHQSGTLMEAVHLMNAGGLDWLPVVEEGNVVGVVLKEDLFKEVLALLVSKEAAQ